MSASVSADDAEAIRRQTKTYLRVFFGLMILTVLTVAVSYLHLSSVMLAVMIGLVIAAVKGSMVASVFMHLSHERKIIYWVLLLTVVFFLVLMFLPVLWHWNLRNVP